MPASSASIPKLDHASHALRQVLLRLDHYAQSQVQRATTGTSHTAAKLAHLGDLQALLAAVEQYEQVVLTCLPPGPVDVLSLTPAELLASRESDPVYRLGWVRGHKAGIAQAQRATAPVLTAYAQYATLPTSTVTPPSTHTDLVQRVRAFLAQLMQRQQAKINSTNTWLYGND
ncbi:hypothetical protein GO988_08895 [Hymenobacter sp. HMF4947]|uniref:Uncharacterized protein n=1 Tax=Hymenobacter ginkgonis TaxID=2682976 RepID=A0A7K1TDG8_9BACT|nr:hypothetical protein [Hymenobacter ginkgonis]MVN76440.1 hypothetical protein [Hymenobacter ginkgonis]